MKKLNIELDVSKINSKKQMYIINEFVKRGNINAALTYIESFSGNRGSKSDVQTVKYRLQRDLNDDMLAAKLPNSILQKFKELFRVDKTHKPTNESSKFGSYIGVEIECFVPHNDECDCPYDEDSDETNHEDCNRGEAVIEALKNESIKRKIKGICFKSDGSISCNESEYTPIEVCVLTSVNDFSNLKAICQLLNEFGAQVNKSCGMHIHLDQRDLNSFSSAKQRLQVTKRAKNLEKALPLLASMVPKSRRTNTYCKLGASKFRGDRYYAINKTAFQKYGTIEVRLHSSTIDFNKIKNWSELIFMLSRKNNPKRVISNVSDLIELLPNVSDNLLTYIESRIRNFSPELYNNVAALSPDLEDRGLILEQAAS